jgi:glycosyltransferase involved in cell wall biosynthesis
LQVERLGLQEEVRFAGFLDLPGKQQQFAGHDIYLSTNRIDNTPVSVLEAAAFGLPVVATRVGGVPFLLQDGQTALLVEDDAAEAMAQAVRRLVEEPGLAGRLSENGRRLAEQFDWSQVLDLWEDAFSAAMGRAG